MKILEAATLAHVDMKKVSTTKGGEYAGPCPKCGGKDRLRVWPEDRGGEGSFWCRQCRCGGDLVQFLVDFCAMEYSAAFREAGREIPEGYTSERFRPVGGVSSLLSDKSSFVPRHYDDPVETWQIRAGKLVDEAHIALLQNDKVLGWLAGRGLDLNAVKRFKLGWFAGENGKDCMYRPRTAWGLDEILKDNGKPKMLWVPRGVVIPWIDDGKIKRIKIRRPGKDLQQKYDVKYYFLPGSSPEPALFYPDRKAFVVVESEFDGLLVIHKAGSVVGCLVLGSAGNKPGSKAYHILKESLRILDALDVDQAGEKAGEWWEQEFDQVKRWPVPVGKDPGEAFEAGVNILEWILEGLPPAITMKFHQSIHPGEMETETRFPREEIRIDPLSQALDADSGISLKPCFSQSLPMVPSVAGQGSTAVPCPEFLETTGLARLHFLLKKYPVKIKATENQTSVICAPAWSNAEVQKEISHLVYFNLDVAEYLESHPEPVVHRGNFYMDGARVEGGV